MSRIGKQPIDLPGGVNLSVDGRQLSVSGPKGNLELHSPSGITVRLVDNKAVISRRSDSKQHRSNHGLARALLQNMITGVTQGFEKKLEISGVGYRVAQQGADLKFNLGYSHDVIYKIPAGVTATIEQNIITVSGINKQQVGQVAAEIRALRKPEPYKGKGIKYVGERIIRKAGKSGKDK